MSQHLKERKKKPLRVTQSIFAESVGGTNFKLLHNSQLANTPICEHEQQLKRTKGGMYETQSSYKKIHRVQMCGQIRTR